MDSWFEDLLEWVGILFIALVLSLTIRTVLFDTRVVPTGSMLPTIQLNDRIIVDKVSLKFSEIERGDIVVFRAPSESGETDDLIKRVIGLPGEKIQIKNGIVFVNGVALKEDHLLEKPDYYYGPKTVPENSYFVLGDNRRNSNDSHIWGFVPQENIKGRALIRFWPLSTFGKLE